MNMTVPDMESVMDRIRDGIRSGRFTVQEVQDAVADKSREMFETADDYVHENPWTAVAIGAGLGLVTGVAVMGADKLQERFHRRQEMHTHSTRELVQSTILFALSVAKAVQAFRKIRL